MEHRLNVELDSLIAKSEELHFRSGEFRLLADEVMKKLYLCPFLYVAMSRSGFSAETMRSTPLISTKDGRPGLYLFTTLDKGLIWCRHYRNYHDRFPLLAEVKKADYDFRQMFPIAARLGVELLMVNEGGAFMGLSLREFVQINRLSLNMMIVNSEKISEILDSDTIHLELPEFDIVRCE